MNGRKDSLQPLGAHRLESRGHLFAWLQLVRLPNAFTVIADVLAGAILVRGTWQPWPLIVTLVVSAVGMYWAGMILNDLYDVDKDRLQNRGRPLVDERISLATARLVAYILLFGGIAATFVVSLVFARGDTTVSFAISSSWLRYSTPLVAVALAIAIWLYDGPLKATVVGPLLMGMCRVGSLLLGISIGWWFEPTQPWNADHLWIAAIGHGVYVMGITWAARREAEATQTWTLGFGWSICVIGIAMLASVSWFAMDGKPMRLESQTSYPIAIALLSLPWARRATFSLAHPGPNTIQAAVKQAILSIIFFDAILALQFGGPWPAITICLLIVPAMLTGRYLKST